MSTVPSTAAAIAPGGLLGAYFKGESWDRWRAVLAAAEGLPLTPEQDVLFREVAGDRDPPTSRVRELWAIAGRRAGKDSIASALATMAALGDYSEVLRPGEMATIACIAATRDQSAIVFQYIRANFSVVPALAALVVKQDDETITLSTGAEIRVSTNSFRTIRGRSIVLGILDEVAYYRDGDSANPDAELLNAIEPAMGMFPEALLIGISSPYRRRGVLFNRWRESFGKPDPDVLVVQGASRVFNAKLPQRIVDRRLAEDPEAGASEYLAAWRSDLSDFIDRGLIDAATERGVVARPPVHGADFRMFVDASGGRGTSFTAAVAHMAEDGTVVLDATFERTAPFDPSNVVREVAQIAGQYGIETVVGDNYAPMWVSEAFAKQGLRYEQSKINRSEIYLNLLPLLTSGRASLLDIPRLAIQLSSLERRASRGGRDSVSAPVGSMDDLANACAGSMVLAESDQRPALVRQADLLKDGAPVPLPDTCTQVYTVIATDKKCARVATITVVLGEEQWIPDIGKRVYPAIVADYTIEPLTLNMFQDIYLRAVGIGMRCRLQTTLHGRLHNYFYLDARLKQAAADVGFRGFEIPEPWQADPETLYSGVPLWTQRGLVKISVPAAEKAKSSPFGGALDFRGGDSGDDPLRRAALWSLALNFVDTPR
jgi:hypothetical protein